MREARTDMLRFRDVLDRYTPRELDKIAMLKRLGEMLVGDPAFRSELKQDAWKLPDLFQSYSIDLDPEAVRPLFDSRVSHFRFENGDPAWPDVNLWDEFLNDKIAYRNSLRMLGNEGNCDARFAAWRARQVERCASELGVANDSIVHAISSYELSSGCTMGCWFCGISAEKFQGFYPSTEANEQLWRGVLGIMQRRFGGASQTGFCYWATDPLDNPDYARFIQIHHEVTGMLPQTTTAAPLRDIRRTREILALTERVNGMMNRFSILTLPILRRVFAEFSPRELLGVELVMQHKEALTRKSFAGRVSRDEKGRKSEETLNQPGTIACVTGFLVNMRERRVRLVSPCPTSERKPDGYHIYGEDNFDDVATFEEVIDRLIEQHMSADLPESVPVRFRSDLNITETPNGFTAESMYRRQAYSHPVFGRELGKLIRAGGRDVTDILATLTELGANSLDVRAELSALRRVALLEE